MTELPIYSYRILVILGLMVAMTELSQFRNTVMVLPGKGGVGKTLVSSTMGILLSRQFKTTLLDVDIITPNLARVMGLAGREPKFNRHRKQEAFTFNENLRVFSVENYFQDNSGIRLGVDECERLISECLTDIDYGPNPIDFLICDMPPAQSDPVKALRRLFPKRLYGIGVTSPTTTSMDNLERTLWTCYDSKIEVLGVIANMVGAEMHGQTPLCSCGCGQPFYPNADRGDGSEVLEFTERMKCDFLGIIKFDPNIGFHYNRGNPAVINNGAIKSAVDRIAGQRGLLHRLGVVK